MTLYSPCDNRTLCVLDRMLESRRNNHGLQTHLSILSGFTASQSDYLRGFKASLTFLKIKNQEQQVKKAVSPGLLFRMNIETKPLCFSAFQPPTLQPPSILAVPGSIPKGPRGPVHRLLCSVVKSTPLFSWTFDTIWLKTSRCFTESLPSVDQRNLPWTSPKCDFPT